MAKKVIREGKKTEEAAKALKLRSFEILPEEKAEEAREIILGGRLEIKKDITDWQRLATLQKHVIRDLEGEALLASIELIEHQKFVDEKKRDYSEKMSELEKVKKKVAVAEKNLTAAKNWHEHLQEMTDSAKKKADSARKFLQEIQTIVLVHSSASWKQMNQYQFGKIYIVKAERKLLSCLLPDEIFFNDKEENFITKFPWDFEEKYQGKEKEAIIEYCNMVITIKLITDENVVALFGNKDIAEILRLNGLEDF